MGKKKRFTKGLTYVVAATLAFATGAGGFVVPTVAGAAVTASAVDAASALAAVNAAQSAQEMRAALEDPMLGLNYGYYFRQPDELRAQVANAVYVMKSKPDFTGFATLADLNTAFSAKMSEFIRKYYNLQSSMSYDTLSSNTRVDVIKTDLVLFQTYESNPVSWTSDRPDIIDPATGKVTRPTGGNADVHLTATVGTGVASYYCTITYTVMDAAYKSPLDEVNAATTVEEFLAAYERTEIDKGDYYAFPQDEKEMFAKLMLERRPAGGWTEEWGDLYSASYWALDDTNNQYVDMLDYNEVSIYFDANDSADHVTGKYIYFTEYTTNRNYPTYTSSRPDIIEAGPGVGKIHRPDPDQGPAVVTITATFWSRVNGTQTKTWNLTVLPLEKTRLQSVNDAQTAAEFEEGYENLAIDRGNYNDYYSDERDKFALAMIKARPAGGWKTKEEVYATAWSITPAFEQQYTYDQVSSVARLSFSGSDTADAVTQPNFSLVGYNVSWQSDHPEYVQISGNRAYVHRPSATTGPVKVRITATFTTGGTKTFDVTVLPLGALTGSVSGVNAAQTAADFKTAYDTFNFDNNYSTYSDPLKLVFSQVMLNNRPAQGWEALDSVYTTALPAARVAEKQYSDQTTYDKVKLSLQSTDDVNHFTRDSLSYTGYIPSFGDVKWSSDHPELVRASQYSATILHPTLAAGDTKVKLTATFPDGRTKSFDLTVAALAAPLTGSVDAANAAQTPASLRTAYEAQTFAKGSYNSYTTDEKNLFAETLLTKRPATGWSSVDELYTAALAITPSFEKQWEEQHLFDPVTITYAAGDSATRITKPINLNSYVSGLGSVTWTSDQPSVLSITYGYSAKLHRPPAAVGDVKVHLTALLSDGRSKTYEVTVAALNPTDQEAVDIATDKLQLQFADGENGQGITQNLTLPSTGLYGTTIQWSSSNPDVLAADGTVHRPHPTVGDQQVTLTAHITRNGVSINRDFPLTVHALEYTPFQATQVTAINNKGKDLDNVIVDNTQAGDVIKVYAADGTTLLGQATATGSITTVSVADLGKEAGTFHVSNTRPGYVENSVEKSFPSEKVKYRDLKDAVITQSGDTVQVAQEIELKPKKESLDGVQYLVIELYEGDKQVGISVVKYTGQTDVTAQFQAAGSDFHVRAFVL